MLTKLKSSETGKSASELKVCEDSIVVLIPEATRELGYRDGHQFWVHFVPDDGKTLSLAEAPIYFSEHVADIGASHRYFLENLGQAAIQFPDNIDTRHQQYRVRRDAIIPS